MTFNIRLDLFFLPNKPINTVNVTIIYIENKGVIVEPLFEITPAATNGISCIWRKCMQQQSRINNAHCTQGNKYAMCFLFFFIFISPCLSTSFGYFQRLCPFIKGVGKIRKVKEDVSALAFQTHFSFGDREWKTDSSGYILFDETPTVCFKWIMDGLVERKCRCTALLLQFIAFAIGTRCKTSSFMSLWASVTVVVFILFRPTLNHHPRLYS